MLLIVVQIIVVIFIAEANTFDDVSNEVSSEMIEDGKNQYQLLQERGKLPRYGECWTSAVEHIHEGCRYLTEDVQSDIALRITNCFLQMSGHETYNCERDKKLNLRGICINSMTDRAFNVYTEFYTHAQNICWFLRGQVWQEKISERTFKVGEQLKNSVNQQEILLEGQRQSLAIQEQLLNYGKSLEILLNHSRKQAENIMEEIKISTQNHQQLLSLMTSSLSGLQSWLIGEISWFDSLVFYIGGAIIIVVITSTTRTHSARLPLLFTLSMNIILERIICDKINFTSEKSQINLIHQDLYKYIWLCRQFTTIICILIILIQAYFYRDYNIVNNELLNKIHEQNLTIKLELEKLKSPKTFEEKYNIVRESSSIETELIKPVVNNYYKPNNSDTNSETSKNSNNSSFVEENKYNFNSSKFLSRRLSVSASRDAFDNFNDKLMNLSRGSNDNLSTSSMIHRYNLRSRPETPVKTSSIQT